MMKGGGMMGEGINVREEDSQVGRTRRDIGRDAVKL
jgi:hypothetical protein